MRLAIDVTLDYEFPAPADVLLAVEVAQLPDQRLIEDLLTVTASAPLRPIGGGEGLERRTWLRAEGRLRAEYRALVELTRAPADLSTLPLLARRELPAEVVPYLWPSRYCESDRFEAFVESRFGALDGGERIAAMDEWIAGQVVYLPGSSDTATTAVDVFVTRRGVCRDYAHLLAAFARAAGIPARLVSAYALDLDPPDFHALVEVWLGDSWHLVDPTGLARPENVVRICAGRDATDIAFMTIFGRAELIGQQVAVRRADAAAQPEASVSRAT
jgi:transglutaminase-like putative cysteine protease